jgi:hypothetical protein
MTKHILNTRLSRRLALAVAVCILTAAPSIAQQTPADLDATLDALLSRYVKSSPDGVNRVDYRLWQATITDRKALDTYITELAARRPSAMKRDDALAYWGNLYNALTVKVILDRYPVASIRDIKSSGGWFDFKSYTGPWNEPRVTVEGKKLSLDNIEHDIMRPTFKDPRVHYVVNCASFGCPNLMNRAWKAATLDVDLDKAARAFINHPRGVTVLPSGGVKVSSIYKWFIADFGGDDAGVVAHFKKYAEPELAARLGASTKIVEDGYDWSLNAVPMTTKSGG